MKTPAVLVLAAILTVPASVAADDEEKTLEAVAIPADKSPSPKASEWASAVRVRPSRRTAACKLDLVREWLRVKCSGEAFAISLLGGDLDGFAYWIDPSTKEGEVMLPLRRGGKHVFQFWRAGKDKAGAFAPEPTVVVQQYWLDGARAPVVTVL